MAINFDTVVGNQSSANVLTQINNNFTKINNNAVPNAEQLNGKPSSDYLPGATEFKQSITTQEFNNLTTGRYFCTQTEQSWEPLYTTTGTRSILLEANIDATHGFKNYNLTYISGIGAGSKYYSHFENNNLVWDKIGSGGGGSLSGVQYYDDIIVYGEGEKLIDGNTINFVHDTYKSWTVSGSFVYVGETTVGESTKYQWNVTLNAVLKNKQGNVVKTYTKTVPAYATEDKTSSYKYCLQIVGPIINLTTGDMIFGGGILYSASSSGDWYEYANTVALYCSTIAITSDILTFNFISYNSYSYRYAIDIICGWYNNIIYFQDWDNTTASRSITSRFCVLDSTTRNTTYTPKSLPIIENVLFGYLLGQKDNKCYTYYEKANSHYIILETVLTDNPSEESSDFSIDGLSSTEVVQAVLDIDNIFIVVKGTDTNSNLKVFIRKHNLALLDTPSQVGRKIQSYEWYEDMQYLYIVFTSNYIELIIGLNEYIYNKLTLEYIETKEAEHCYIYSDYGISNDYMAGEYTRNLFLCNPLLNIGPIIYYSQNFFAWGLNPYNNNERLSHGNMWSVFDNLCSSNYLSLNLECDCCYTNKFFSPSTKEEKYIGNLHLYFKLDANYNLFDQADASTVNKNKDIYYIDGIGWLCGNRILDLTDQSRMIKSVYTD